MSGTRLYRLEFLFDRSQLDEDDLRARVSKAIDRQRDGSVEVEVEAAPSVGPTECLKLSICGSLEEVDHCHDRLRHEVTHQCRCILIRDDAGDEVRRQAYPVLAQLERPLRTFINRAMTEIIGFDWWAVMAPRRVQTRVEEIGVDGSKDHPVELTYFNDLTDLVTGSVRKWPEGRAMSVGDLSELLEGCSSIDELRDRLAQKTRRVSLWEEVFARYYPSEEQKQRWTELKQTVRDTVVPVRNRVMHHRPVFRWELEKLRDAREEADDLINSAVMELPDEERIKARDTSAQWAERLAHTAISLEDIRRMVETAAQPAVDFARLAARIQQQAEDLGAVMATVSQPSEHIRRMVETAGQPAVDFARLAARIQQQAEDLGAVMATVSEPSEDIRRMIAEVAERSERWTWTIAGISRSAMEAGEREEQQDSQLHGASEPAESETLYVGSAGGVKFHRVSCTYADRIKPCKRVSFPSRDDALNEGYSPCTACRP